MRTTSKEMLRYYPTRTITLSPVEVAAGTTAAQVFAAAQVPGLKGLHTSDMVVVKKTGNQAGLFVAGAWVSAESQLTILFANVSAAPILPSAAEDYVITTVGAN
jgi:hypothetical protein